MQVVCSYYDSDKRSWMEGKVSLRLKIGVIESFCPLNVLHIGGQHLVLKLQPGIPLIFMWCECTVWSLCDFFSLYKFSPAVRFIFILVQPHPHVPPPARRFYFPRSQSCLWNAGRVFPNTCLALVGSYELDSARYPRGSQALCLLLLHKVQGCLVCLQGFFLSNPKLVKHNTQFMFCYCDMTGHISGYWIL